ncbi:hypothetical protein [Brevibacillus porteri]|uniref:hypothetical protein n=1 Tax=Brevibacillus porteri TaxID=2126350 RepID=UPI003640E843
MRKERKKLKIVGHFMTDGVNKFEIDPTKGDLPDRCKLAWAEMMSGLPHELTTEKNALLEASGS